MGDESPFATQRAWFRGYLREVLLAAEPITADNVWVVEHLLMDDEVDAAARALREAGPPPFAAGTPLFVRQRGTTCMSTSLANAMISLGEPFLLDDPEPRVATFTDHVVARTSSMGKPGEYRSVDDLFKYLEAGALREVTAGGERFRGEFRARLTCSLLDVCEGLWSGRARLVVQRRAHAHLVYGLEAEGDAFWAMMRDPMAGTGQGYQRVSLAALRRDYLWSPLKKVPRLMGPHGFPSLGADELIAHLDRYDSMDNLGVDCPSALVFRAEDAPALFAPARDEPAEPVEARGGS